VGQEIKVLLVEDSESDGRLLVRRLAQAGYAVESERVDSAKAMSAAIERSPWDVVLCGPATQRFDPAAALRALQGTGKDIPFLMVSGDIGEEAGQAPGKPEAGDFAAGDNLARLASVVVREGRGGGAHRELQAAQRLQEVVAASPAALVSFCAAGQTLGRIQFISDNVETLFGYSPGAALSEGWWTANLHSADAALFAAAAAEVFRDGYAEREFRFRRQDGAWRWTRAEIRLVRDARGAPAEAVCCWSDITERRLAQDAQLQMREQVQQAEKLESIGRLAGGVAHDFNNLLTVINGYTTLLLKKTAPTDPMHDALGEIRMAGERATSLSRQLLTLSRKTAAQQEDVDLNEVALEAGRMLTRIIGEEIRLETHLDPDLRRILGDAAQINQVLMNLVVNARDAMPGGGVIRIETRNVELNAVEAMRRALVPGHYVRLRVTDTGGGIPKDVMPHLFEPFFTTKQSGQGSGLGLATVYGIVKHSEGAIEIQNEENAGATVTIHFPESRAETPQPRAAAGSSDAAGTGAILLVEDDEQVRRVSTRILRDSGYCVLECAGFSEACEHAAKYPGEIGMLLTDLAMPERSGIELARSIRELRPQIRIVVMSGYTEHSGIEQARAELKAGYLGKPFTPADLRAKVLETMSGPGRGETILVVDDEAPVRAVLREFLASAGYRVVEAANGAEAVRQVRAGRVDVMITDLSMPEQEGLETIQLLHKQQPQLKMIAMSGRFPGPILRAAETFGANASLSKPVQCDQLLQTVARVIQGDSQNEKTTIYRAG